MGGTDGQCVNGAGHGESRRGGDTEPVNFRCGAGADPPAQRILLDLRLQFIADVGRKQLTIAHLRPDSLLVRMRRDDNRCRYDRTRERSATCFVDARHNVDAVTPQRRFTGEVRNRLYAAHEHKVAHPRLFPKDKKPAVAGRLDI